MCPITFFINKSCFSRENSVSFPIRTQWSLLSEYLMYESRLFCHAFFFKTVLSSCFEDRISDFLMKSLKFLLTKVYEFLHKLFPLLYSERRNRAVTRKSTIFIREQRLVKASLATSFKKQKIILHLNSNDNSHWTVPC